MSGTTINNDVTSEAQLNDAIATFDGETSAGTYTIDLAGSTITEGTDGGGGLPLDLYAISNAHAGVSVVIDGGGGTLDGDGKYRGLLVFAGNATIENLTIQHAAAIGGAGGSGGGGGGAGLGGGLFVAGTNVVAGTTLTTGGTVTLNNVSFASDSATGGAGGSVMLHADDGGGGGLGGAGGTPGASGGGGGGVGVGATGGGSSDTTGAVGIVNGASGGGAGLGSGAGAGGASGGGGGAADTAGGGGVGGQVGTLPSSLEPLGFSGAGGFGGGGGGGHAGAGVDHIAGAGGFGGGGGAGFYGGGRGGFGGGGGSVNEGGYAGFGGGAANNSGADLRNTGGGGGGLGASGDVFVQQGGTLLIEGGSLAAGTVKGGAGGKGVPLQITTFAGSGRAIGNGLFIQGNQAVTLAPAVGQTLTIAGVVADVNGSGGTGQGDGALVIGGSGSVVLSAINTFTGGATLEAGTTFALTHASEVGGGPVALDAGAVLQVGASLAVANTIEGFAPGDTIDLLQLPFGGLGETTLYNAGALTISNGGGGTAKLQMPGVPTGLELRVGSDGAGGTDITASATIGPGTTSEAQLNTAIAAFDTITTPGTYTINLTHGITEGTDGGASLPLDLYAIHNPTAGVVLVINGDHETLDGAGAYRGLFVHTGNVTIENLTITDAKAIGGSGGADGGGGGAGLGGGLFVASASTVTLDGVAFTDDSATGGAGGVGAGGTSSDGGGGGGLGGAGGAAGGGGGGGVGAGATGASMGKSGAPGIVKGALHAGSGIGVNGLNGSAGGASGGGGGSTSENAGFGGGGGVGGFNATVRTSGGGGGISSGGGGGQVTGGMSATMVTLVPFTRCRACTSAPAV